MKYISTSYKYTQNYFQFINTYKKTVDDIGGEPISTIKSGMREMKSTKESNIDRITYRRKRCMI
jgi:phage-related protein